MGIAVPREGTPYPFQGYAQLAMLGPQFPHQLLLSFPTYLTGVCALLTARSGSIRLDTGDKCGVKRNCLLVELGPERLRLLQDNITALFPVFIDMVIGHFSLVYVITSINSRGTSESSY